MASRVRPARRPRWRRYVPAATLALSSLLPILAPSVLAEGLAALGLSLAATRIVLASAGVLVAMLAASLANRRPVVALIVGTSAVSLGGNLLAGAWVGVPLLAAGLGWILLLEARRRFEGLTISPEGLTLHRAIRDPLTIGFDDVRAVHTTMHTDRIGTLILETAHGTVTAQHLPGCQALQARLEARMNRVPVRATEDSLSQARGRLQGLLEGSNAT